MEFEELLKNLDIKEFIEKLKNVEVLEFLKALIEKTLATSELNVLKRLSVIEETVGIDTDTKVTEQENVIERLDTIEEKLDNLTPVQSVNPSTLEQKAVELVEYLKYEVPERNGSIFMTAKEVIHFLKSEVSEHLRLGDTRNPRQAKKDVIERAQKLFPNLIKLDKRKNGNNEVRVIFKPLSVSTEHLHTYTSAEIYAN